MLIIVLLVCLLVIVLIVVLDEPHFLPLCYYKYKLLFLLLFNK